MAISYSISYTFSPSTTISSSQVNQNFTDNSNTWNGIEAKTKTFSNLGVDTELKSAGVVSAANGTVAAPSVTFTNSTGTGLYRIGADDLGIATAGVVSLELTSAQLVVPHANVSFDNTSTHGIVGATNGFAGAAGNVGEYIESVIGFTNCPSTGTWGDLTSISLTAGDWDVTGIVESTANGATITRFIVGISSTTGNFSTGLVDGSNQVELPIASNGVRLAGGAVPSYRVLISTTTIYYLKLNATYSVATAQAAGRLSARRVR